MSIRYALDQGGAACAVDIEESVHGEEHSINVSLHNMQKRHDHMDVRVTGKNPEIHPQTWVGL